MHTSAACVYFWYSFDNVLLICLFWPYVLNSLAKTFLESKFSRLFKTSGFLKLVVLQIFFSIFWLRVCKLLCVESCMCCLCLMFVIVIPGQKRNFINLQDWFLVQSWRLIKFFSLAGDSLFCAFGGASTSQWALLCRFCLGDLGWQFNPQEQELCVRASVSFAQQHCQAILTLIPLCNFLRRSLGWRWRAKYKAHW